MSHVAEALIGKSADSVVTQVSTKERRGTLDESQTEDSSSSMLAALSSSLERGDMRIF